MSDDKPKQGPPPSEATLNQLKNIPLDEVPPPIEAKANEDSRQKSLNDLMGIDAHLLTDDLSSELTAEESTKLRELYKVKPDDAYNQALEIGKTRMIPKLLGGPMSQEQWDALRQYSGDLALQHAPPEVLEKLGGQGARDTGIKHFDDTVGKYYKYAVVQPPPQDAAPPPKPAAAGAPKPTPQSSPKSLPAPSDKPSNQFARSLIDMVRGAGQVGEQQQKTGRTVNDALFERVLRGSK